MKHFLGLTILFALSTSLAAGTPVSGGAVDNFDSCNSSMIDRYVWVNSKSTPEAIQSMALSEKRRLAKDIYRTKASGLGSNGAWENGLTPLIEAQFAAITDSLLLLHDPSLNTLEKAWNFLQTPEPRKFRNPDYELILGGQLPKFESLISSLSDLKIKTTRMDEAKIVAACGAITGVLNALQCKNGVLLILQDAAFGIAPSSNLILPKLWVEFVQSKKLKEGVRQVALKLLSRVHGGPSNANVLEDFKSGFVAAGFDNTQATEAAWKLIAVVASGGANTGARLLGYDLPEGESALVVGLSVIGSTLVYLDMKQVLQSGKQYMYPVESAGVCRNPKPYHFWLSAYFSRNLSRRGYSAEVASSAAFVVANGYQMNRNVANGRAGKAEKLLSLPTLHPTNNVIRMDLVQAATGALYGVQPKTQAQFNLTKNYDRAMRMAMSQKPLSSMERSLLNASEDLKMIYAWDRFFDPSGIYSLVSRDFKQ